MRDVDYAWAAGFFDGEGSVSIRTLRQKTVLYYGLYIRVSQVDRAPLEKFALLFGGSIRKSRAADDRRAPYHDWCAAGSTAAVVLAQLLPYLTVKRERTELGLEFQRRIRMGATKITTEERTTREQYYERMRFLNLRQVSRTAAETKSETALRLVATA